MDHLQLQPGDIGSFDHDAIPRLLLPTPATLFEARAARLRQLAAGDVPGIPVDDTLRGYLTLMAYVADAQHAVVTRLHAPKGIISALRHGNLRDQARVQGIGHVQNRKCIRERSAKAQ